MKNINQQKVGIGFGLLILAFGIALVSPAMAQNVQARGEGREILNDRQIERMQETLELSDTQVEQIKQLQQSQSDARSERTAKLKEEASARRAEATEQRTEAREAFEAILTPEQLAKMPDLKQREVRGQRAVRGRRAIVAQNRAVRGRRSVRDFRSSRRSRVEGRLQNRRMNSTVRDGRMWNRDGARSAEGPGFTMRNLRGLELTAEQQTQVSELTSTLQSDASEWRLANTEATAEQKQEFRSSQDATLQAGLESILTTTQLAILKDRKDNAQTSVRRRGRR